MHRKEIEMPKLGDLLTSDAIAFQIEAKERKDVFRALAKLSSTTFGLDENQVFEAILERENLGGTGLGEGVAVPHARLKGLEYSCGVFALLKDGVDFEGPDGKPADLVFLLLSPEDAAANHLKALAKITRMMRQPGLRASLRNARSKDAVFALLVDAGMAPQVA